MVYRKPVPSGPLNDQEKSEFDQANADHICSITDVAKLERAENYYRSEGFERTAEVVAVRMRELVGAPATPAKSAEQLREDIEELLQWTSQAKEFDEAVKQSQVVGQAPPPIPKVRRHVHVATDTATPQAKQPPLPAGGSGRGPDGRRLPGEWEQMTKALEQSEREEARAEANKKAFVDSESTIRSRRGRSGAMEGRRLAQEYMAQHPGMLLPRAQTLKDDANDHFKAGEMELALNKYEEARHCLDAHPPRPDRDALLSFVLSNIAAVHVNAKEWPAVIEVCERALRLKPDNIKARMRRAKAFAQTGNWKGARDDSTTVLETEPNLPEMLRIKEQAERRLDHGSVPVSVTEVDGAKEAPEERAQSATADEAARPMSSAGASGATAEQAPQQPSSPARPIRVPVQDDSDDDDESVGFCSAESRENEAAEPASIASEGSAGADGAHLSAVRGPAASAVSPADAPGTSDAVDERESTPPADLGPPPKSPQERAGELKNAGNEAFKAHNLVRADHLYTEAIDACPNLDAPYCNRSMVRLKQGDWLGVVNDCSTALALGPPTDRAFKMFLRRAQALVHLQAPERAVKDCRVARTLAGAIADRLAAVQTVEAVVQDAARHREGQMAEARAMDTRNAAAIRAQRRKPSLVSRPQGNGKVTITEVLSDDEDDLKDGPTVTGLKTQVGHILGIVQTIEQTAQRVADEGKLRVAVLSDAFRSDLKTYEQRVSEAAARSSADAASSAATAATPTAASDAPAEGGEAPARDSATISEDYIVVPPPAADPPVFDATPPPGTEAAMQRADELREDGKACFLAGDFQGALAQWSAALELHPLDVRIHNNLAAGCLRTGDATHALGCAEAAVRLAATCDAKSASKAYLRRSEAHVALGNAKQGLKDLDESKRLLRGEASGKAEPADPPAPTAAPPAAAAAAASDALPSREWSYEHVSAPECASEEPGRLIESDVVPLADVEQTVSIGPDGSEVRTYHVFRDGRIPLNADAEAAATHAQAPAALGDGDSEVAEDTGPLDSKPDGANAHSEKGTAKSSVLDNLQQDIAAKAVDMPVPCTSQDVKTACKRLKHSPGELAEYIGSIPPISYKKLLKKDLDIDTLRCFATALKERVGGDPLWAEASIKALGTVDRFRVLSIMSSDVKAMLGDVEKQIEASNA